jgi:hypothetical protein
MVQREQHYYGAEVLNPTTTTTQQFIAVVLNPMLLCLRHISYIELAIRYQTANDWVLIYYINRVY